MKSPIVSRIGFGLAYLVAWVALQLGRCHHAAAQSPQPKSPPNVIEPAEIFTLKHRWELDPELNPRWKLDIVPPQLRIDVEAIRSGSQRECLFELEQVFSYRLTRGIENSREVADNCIQRLSSSEDGRALQLALVSSALLMERSSAERLWALVKDRSPAFKRPVEAALIEASSNVAIPEWRERLKDSNATTKDLMLAVKGLGAIGMAQDRDRFIDLLVPPQLPTPLRVAIANSLGQSTSEGLEETAGALLTSRQEHGALLASYLLQQHGSSASLVLADKILGTSHRPAQVVAFSQLARHAPESASQYLNLMLSHPDAPARKAALEFASLSKPAECLPLLQQGLSDPIASVREFSRQRLAESATKAQLRDGIRDLIRATLAEAAVAGKEQACILVGETGYDELCPQLIDLLKDEEPAIHCAAAWALQRVATAPEMLQAIEKHIRRVSQDHFASTDWMPSSQAVQVAYLMECLGRNRVSSIEDLLRKFIPKTSGPPVSRASAIWALGLLMEGSQDADLAGRLAARLHDESQEFPEATIVKYVSAISMARIRHPSSKKQLESHYERPPFPIGLAREWALQAIED